MENRSFVGQVARLGSSDVPSSGVDQPPCESIWVFQEPRPTKLGPASQVRAGSTKLGPPPITNHFSRSPRPCCLRNEIVRIRRLKGARVVKITHVVFGKSPSGRAKIGF